MVRIGRHEGLMAFREDWNPCAPGGAPTSSFERFSRGPEKLEFIALNELLAEGEKYVKELEELRACGRRARNSG